MKKYISLCLLFIFLSINVSAQEWKTHTVQTGETLYAISKTLNVTITELKSWNNLSDNNLSVGQQLIYFLDATPESLENPTVSPSLITTSVYQENVFYKVKSGDNLTVIARIHGMTIKELKDLNNLTSDFLSIGQQLTVKKIRDSVGPSVSEFSEDSSPQGSFAVYEISGGDSVSSILNKFKLTETELQELNPGINLSSLEAGQRITVLLPPSKSYVNPYSNKSKLEGLGTIGVSVYNKNEFGAATTNGELYNPEELTAAHSNIALGTIIFVENPETQRGIYIRINDRISGSELKLSAEAYRILGLINSSNPTVTIYTDRL